jgi:adenine phosphoribosyltransferase
MGNPDVEIRRVIRDIPDFPKPGILFKDITPVLEQPAAYAAAIAGLRGLLEGVRCDRLAAIESRGFVFGGPLALQLGLPLALVRKKGKLPAATRAVTYALEYGTATIEAHLDSFAAGQRVVIVDDLLATGGTALAAAQLVREAGAEVAGFLFLVELEFLGGRTRLQAEAPVFSLVNFA